MTLRDWVKLPSQRSSNGSPLRPSGHLPDLYTLIHDDRWWAWYIRDSNGYLSRGSFPSPQMNCLLFHGLSTHGYFLTEHRLAWPVFNINPSPLNTTQWSLSSYMHSTTYGFIYPLVDLLLSQSDHPSVCPSVHLSTHLSIPCIFFQVPLYATLGVESIR